MRKPMPSALRDEQNRDTERRLGSLPRLRANKLLLKMYGSITAAFGRSKGIQFVCLNKRVPVCFCICLCTLLCLSFGSYVYFCVLDSLINPFILASTFSG